MIQRTSALILSSIEPPAADAAPVMAKAIQPQPFPFPPKGTEVQAFAPVRPTTLATSPKEGFQMQNRSAFQYLAIDIIHESTTNPRRTFE